MDSKRYRFSNTGHTQTWGADILWYGFTGYALILIGSAINTYIDFPQPFRAAKMSKR